MHITNIRIERTNKVKHVANASVVLDNTVSIHNIKIIANNKGGKYIVFPQNVFVINDRTRKEIQKRLINAL